MVAGLPLGHGCPWALVGDGSGADRDREPFGTALRFSDGALKHNLPASAHRYFTAANRE